ncbi:MAG: tyrosine--tRNA ligase, partial [Candidatus Aenigmarchaeota archaeon]|nr:tyrosine--tRNA ligase [Candidatus Aenigmarchaeota archaeon]MDI6722278.1 tyrosine--tRNA ligase [Candidatus Aenigmarchaeota archaeon]
GFEPSGMAHLPFGIYRPLLLEDLNKAGIHFKLWLADSFAWINNKIGGDPERIRRVGEYFIEVWKTAGVKNAEFLWASDAFSDRDYWKKVILIAKNTSVARATRALTIMGRREGEMKEVAQYFYPMMQAADIFHLKADIAQLGLDQRRAGMTARDVCPKLGWSKPVIVSHHMLMGLEGIKKPEGYEQNEKMDMEISSKMSKSKPNTAIFVHDTKDEIRKKINSAFCPEKQSENNPVMEYSRYLIFKKFGEMKVERDKKFGGDILFNSYNELESAYTNGGLHPADLKNAVAEYLDKMISPIRSHFDKGKAKELYDFVRKQQVTR